MLRLTEANDLPHLVMIMDHDDKEREYEYHKTLMLKVADSPDWPVVSM